MRKPQSEARAQALDSLAQRPRGRQREKGPPECGHGLFSQAEVERRGSWIDFVYGWLD